MLGPDFDLGKYNPKNARVTEEHEYFIPSDDNPLEGLVGITPYAAGELGDVVYIQLPEVGSKIKQSEKFGEVESVKAVSDLFAPVTGDVLEDNTELVERPELVNQAPFGAGWMLRVSLADEEELKKLMNHQAYQAYLQGFESH